MEMEIKFPPSSLACEYKRDHRKNNDPYFTVLYPSEPHPGICLNSHRCLSPSLLLSPLSLLPTAVGHLQASTGVQRWLLPFLVTEGVLGKQAVFSSTCDSFITPNTLLVAQGAQPHLPSWK